MSDSGSASTSQLRWVRYDGIYYAALLVPAAEAPVDASDIPEGHQFVFFLPDSGAVVPNDDIEPYNPEDTEKASNPAAAEGVAMANAMFYGTGGTQEGADASAMDLEMDDEDTLARLMMDGDDEKQRKEEKKKKKEKKKEEKKEKKKRNRRDEADEDAAAGDDDDDIAMTLGITSSRKEKLRKKKEEEEHDLEESEEEEDDDDEEEEDGRGSSSPSKKNKKASNHWQSMAEDYDLGDVGTPRTATRTGGRSNGLSSALNALVSQLSPVSAYLTQIKHTYQQLWNEATEKQMLLTAFEVDAIRAVEKELVMREAKVSYLERVLASSNEASSKENREAISQTIKKLQGEVNVDAIVRDVVKLRAGHERTDTTRGNNRANNSAYGRFQDPLVYAMVRNSASAAVPRELTHDVANKYRDQLIHRERVLAANRSSGLGKIGLYGVAPSYMDNWNRARELMVLAPAHENQPVKPTGYISRHHAEALSRVEDHAKKRFSTGLASQQQQQQQQSLHASQGGFMTGESLSDLFRNNYSQHRDKPAIPAYYSFHDLNARSGSSLNMDSAGAGVSDGGMVMGSLLNTFSDDNHHRNQNLVSPLHLGFDHKAEFQIDSNVAGGDHMPSRSSMMSASMHLPSEESQWYSEAYSVAPDAAQDTRKGTSSRASSVASSHVRGGAERRRGASSRRSAAGANSTSGSKPADWRGCAKRAILEQLTLYFRGLKGRPAVITEEELQSTARKLLERAMKHESARQGVSMVLQVSNSSASFTKDVEASLKKSVDSYVQKHFIQRNGDANVLPAFPVENNNNNNNTHAIHGAPAVARAAEDSPDYTV